jgi:hypothetical protein
MSRLTTNLNGFTGVAAGSTAIVPLPNDRRIHGIRIYYSNTAGGATPTKAQLEADVLEIRVIANGKPIRRVRASELNTINAYRGIAYIAGAIQIDFAEQERRTPDGEELVSLVTQGIGALTLEIDIAGTAAAPGLSATVEYDFYNDKNRAFVLWERVTIPNPTAGDFDWNTLPKRGAYSRLHLLSANVTRVQTFVDGTTIFDRTVAQNAAVLARYSLTPQAAHYPVDFGYTRQITDVLDMVRSVNGQPVNVLDFNNKITTSAGGSFQAIVERLVYDLHAYIS